MKTLFKYSTFYFLFIVILSGCKKEDKNDENNTSFPVTLYAEKATVVSETKVYVKGGLLNDPEKTLELMSTYSRQFRLEKELQNAGEAFMSFRSKDSVDFFNKHSPYVISRNGEMLTITSAIQSISPLPYPQNQLYHHVAKYQSIKTEGDAEISKDIRIAYGSGYQEYKIPMFAYVTSSWMNSPVNGLNRRGGLVINEFNADVINRIGDRDTIVVKTYLLTVKAK